MFSLQNALSAIRYQIYYDGNCTDTDIYCMRHGFESGTGGLDGNCFNNDGAVMQPVSLVIQQQGWGH